MKQDTQNEANSLPGQAINQHANSDFSQNGVFKPIVGQHPAMMQVLQLINRVAPTDATVLIIGETGTGKELVANALHYKSMRRNGPLIPVNCAALPENLLESELFGHVRGAYTGAVDDKPGWFECADHGTIFLDEIDSMPLALQARLLRILQTNNFSRLGSRKIRHCNVRVVAAANHDIRELVKIGQFRQELYFRLNLLEICLPPLRERRSDISLLADYFLKHYTRKHKKLYLRFSPKVTHVLLNYDYPGNVRELENMIHGGVIQAQDRMIRRFHLPSRIQCTALSTANHFSAFKLAKKCVIQQFEVDYLSKCLRATEGNITRAARMAGLHVSNFHRKMEQHHLRASSFKP